MADEKPAGAIRLDGHHRQTLEKIFAHPTSHNIQWHDVLSLLGHVGTLKEHHDGKYVVTIGDQTESLDPARQHDVDIRYVVDLRRMMASVGITPETV